MLRRSFKAERENRRQQGLSLVEFALAMVILGITVLVAWQYGMAIARRQAAVQSRFLFERAEEATMAFSFLNARLPCPAADASGLETCDGRVEGYLPYRTLGLPDASAGSVRYRLDSLALATKGAASFEVLVPVLRGADNDLVAEPVALQTVATADNDHMTDFCAALMRRNGPDAQPADDAAVFRDAVGGFDGSGVVVRRSKLWHDLNCGALLSTAGRAHFDARLQAAVMRRAIGDYRTQFDIAYGLYEWDFSQSNWFVANSSHSLLKTVVKFEIARSAWLASLETNPGSADAMLLAAAALATSALHTSVYASTVGRGAANLSNARKNRGVLDPLIAQAEALDRDIARHALANSSNFLFLPQQALTEAEASKVSPDIRAPDADPRIERLGQEARNYLDLIGRL